MWVLIRNWVKQILIHTQYKCLLGIKCQRKLTGGEKSPGENIIMEILLQKFQEKLSFVLSGILRRYKFYVVKWF